MFSEPLDFRASLSTILFFFVGLFDVRLTCDFLIPVTNASYLPNI
jgi:hypothetical protein